MRMRRAVVVLLGALVFVGGVSALILGDARAQAQISVTNDAVTTTTTTPPTVDRNGVQHLHYEYGPLDIKPGQNLIQNSTFRIPQPDEAGWIVGFKPNLKLPNGKVPAVDVLHLHHGVWSVLTRRDATAPFFPERFIPAGEEKTALELPTATGTATRRTTSGS